MTKRITQMVVVLSLVCLATSSISAAALSDLADAAMKGDRATLDALLTQGTDVNAPQVDGSTALHWAIYRGDGEMVATLLRAGADIKAVTREGVSPMYLAALYGHAGIIDQLLKAGADVNERGPNGETPLMFAARNGNPEAVKTLIAAGADVNVAEPVRNTTALMWAAASRNSEAVAALLAAGADHSMRSAPSGSPRVYMARPVNVDIVRQSQIELLAKLNREKGLPPPALPQNASNAGAGAQEEADGPVAGLVGGDGGMLTALIFAAREGDLESARLLVEAGADINQTTNFGWTAVMTAVQNRNYELAKFLVEKGADVNIANKGGWTPLYLATDNRNIEGGDYPWPKPDMDHLEMIRILLEAGADPNARVKANTLTRTIFTQQWLQEPGATAFVRAAQSGDTELMRLLLAFGADPAIPTDGGDTALSVAAGIGWVDGVTYEWSEEENVEAIKLLLDLGLDPNAVGVDGRTPLMGAALKGRNEVVRLLVDAGARLETRDWGSRDTDRGGTSALAGHTWQAIDYAEGLVRVGVQSATIHPETASLIRQMMTERGLPVPDPNRSLDSICIVVLCMGELLPGIEQ